MCHGAGCCALPSKYVAVAYNVTKLVGLDTARFANKKRLGWRPSCKDPKQTAGCDVPMKDPQFAVGTNKEGLLERKPDNCKLLQ